MGFFLFALFTYNKILIEQLRFTIYSTSDLSFDYDLLSQTLAKKAAFIENQMVARSMTNLTAQQLDGYSETFHSCDKRNANSLEKDEFKLALKAEGAEVPVWGFQILVLKRTLTLDTGRPIRVTLCPRFSRN